MPGYDWIELGQFEEEFITPSYPTKHIPYVKPETYIGRMFTLEGDRYNKWVVLSVFSHMDKLTLVHYMDKTNTKEMWASEFKRVATEVIF